MAKPKQTPEQWMPRKVGSLDFLHPNLTAFCNSKTSPRSSSKKLYDEGTSIQDTGNYILPGHDFRQFGFLH